MNRPGAKFLVPLLVGLILWGCLEEIGDLDKIEDYTWNPELALPITNSTFGFVEFLDDPDVEDFIEVDQDGLIIISYQEQFQSDDASSYVEITDESSTETMSFDAPTLGQLPIDLTVSKTQTFDFVYENPEGDEIDSVMLTSGNMQLGLNGNFPASGEVSFTFSSALENGLPLQRTYSWTYTGQQPSLDVIDVIDLSNFKLDLTGGGVTSNIFLFDVTLTLFYEGEAVLPENELNIDIQLLDADFSIAYGLFATRAINSTQENINLDFFESFTDGSLYLDEPSITLDFANSYGIPIGIDLNNLTFSNTTETQALTGPVASTTQIIAAPDINQVGEIVSSSIVIDNTNSNLPDLVSLLPTQISYQVAGSINPEGLNQRSFVLGESIVDVNVDLELPLFGRISGLTVEQEFELDGADVFDNFNYALFKLTVDNGFPIDTEVQVYFLDAAGQILDVLIDGDPNIVSSGEIDANGIVTNSTQKVSEIEMNKAKIDAVRDTKTLLLEASFSTSQNGSVSVKILDSYNIGIKMGIQTEFNVVIEFQGD